MGQRLYVPLPPASAFCAWADHFCRRFGPPGEPFRGTRRQCRIQDADNLAWKLAAVLAGKAPEALLESYNAERVAAADENILNSTRSTDFITPKSEAARAYRDAVLTL